MGLGLNFCPIPKFTTKNYADVNRFRRDIFTKLFFAHQPLDTTETELFVRSDWEPPTDQMPDEIRDRMLRFTRTVSNAYPKQRMGPNLTKIQLAALSYLRQNNIYMVIKSDKNLGPCLIEKEKYIQLAFCDHLNDNNTYRQLSATTAMGHKKAIIRRINNFIQQYETYTEDDIVNLTSDGKFLSRSLKANDDFAKFYLLAKIHNHH